MSCTEQARKFGFYCIWVVCAVENIPDSRREGEIKKAGREFGLYRL